MATQLIRRRTKYQPATDRWDRHGKELLTAEYITRRSEPGQFVPMRKSQVKRGNFGKLRSANFEQLVQTRLYSDGKHSTSVKKMFEELNSFVEDHCGSMADPIRQVREIIQAEIEVFKRSFRRGLAYRFALDITHHAHLSPDYKYHWLLETKLAQLLSSLDELRNCADQERNEYYVDQLLDIYAVLDGFVNEFIRKTQTPGYTDISFDVKVAK